MPLTPILMVLLAAADPATAAPTAPAPPPSTAPVSTQSAPAATPPPASIETILQGSQSPSQASDDEDQPAVPPATPPPPAATAGQSGPAPYSELDFKAYTDAILASARAAQAMQGPLDGGWTVTGADGKRLYSLRLVDHGLGMGQAEGAWRDLAITGPGAAGIIASVSYDGDKLSFRFFETGPDDPVTLNVRPASDKDWPGELWRHGAPARVTFSRQ